jgi:hypothetical protein
LSTRGRRESGRIILSTRRQSEKQNSFTAILPLGMKAVSARKIVVRGGHAARHEIAMAKMIEVVPNQKIYETAEKLSGNLFFRKICE